MTQESALRKKQLEERAVELRKATGFAMTDCKKALLQTDGNFETAKRFLASGKWRTGKLITWDYDGLTKTTLEMQLATKLDTEVCRTALMNAGGNLNLALEQLQVEGTFIAA